MAQQKKNSSSRGGSGKKNTGSSRSKSCGSKTASSSRSGAAKKSTSSRSTGSRSAAARKSTRTKPIRREAGGCVLLFLGIVSVIALFPTEGFVVDAWRSLARGLFGWGYFISPVVLLWGAFILLTHRGRPVALRLTCILLLGVVFGAFVHGIWCERAFFVSGFLNGIADLWDDGRRMVEHCGGAISGLLGIALRRALSVYGAGFVLAAAFLLMLIEGLNLSLSGIFAAIAAWYQARPKLFYEPQEDEEFEDDLIEEADRLNPDDYLFPLDGSSPVRRAREKMKENRQAEKKGKAAAKAEAAPAVRPRMYDEDWEEHKDRIFAAMEIDEGAMQRVAAAVAAEKAEMLDRRQKEALAEAAEARKAAREASRKPAETGKIVSIQQAVAEAKKSASPKQDTSSFTKDVEPASVEEAAKIAGMELNSADLDGGAASPAAAPGTEKLSKADTAAGYAAVAAEIDASDAGDKPVYIFPSLSLLNKSKPGDGDGGGTDDGEARLEAAIRSYGVGATITGAVRGPSITRYELKLDQGVKLSKIENLGKDIALSLGVESVRIAPIPDKVSTVGVEVPNRNRTTVWLGDLIDSDIFRNSKSKLSVAMGKDIAGNVIVGNIAKMPHVLIAGTTGSGKSVCVNSMILSLLYKSTPEEVRMIMIDPKMVEFVVYNGMPHLYVPVVTDPKKAAGALQWAVVEMLKRYRLFSETGVRDLAGYNAVLKNNDQPPLPQVVIFIDELADLMMIAAKEVEESICRVAQMGRAAGMHLVVATQSPRADVITGLMKANIPSRIALSVASSLESRIILDQQGAESLVGNGDMLFAPIGRKPTRVQGAFVTDEEREEIISFIKKEAEAEYSDEILEAIDKAAAEKEDKGAAKEEPDPQNDYDELLPQAVEVIFETKQASVSMLQRRLKLGYSRAARLIDQLEEVGVVGPYEGSKPRKIMITKQQWQEMQYSQGTAPVDTIADEFSQLADNDSFAGDDGGDDEDDPVTSAEVPAEADGEEAPWEEDDPE